MCTITESEKKVGGKRHLRRLWDGKRFGGGFSSRLKVCLLTAGDDRPYALGIGSALAQQGVEVDFIASDKLDSTELRRSARINFLNIRGDQSEEARLREKVVRIALYYVRLISYALTSKPQIFHILWNNRFEHFDRTLLMLYYRVLGKAVVLTAHNVNQRKRDQCDNWFNRLTLSIQYGLCNHIFVHTDAMKRELLADFGIRENVVSVIPFGINNTIPATEITGGDAKRRLGMSTGDKALLFFGQIAPYKGLEYLVDALAELAKSDARYRLIIAGKVKRGHENVLA